MPCRSTISTRSPRWNSLSVSLIPAGSKLPFPFLRAVAAPSSTIILPREDSLLTIHLFLLSSLVVVGRKRVPMDSPSASLVMTSGRLPSAMATAMAELVATLAAAILVAIPPVPRLVPAPPAMRSISASILFTVGMSLALESRRGSAVQSPATSLSSIRRLASTRLATMAERLSLSPNLASLISSVATTSFSLMMGTTLKSSKDRRVLRALR